MKKALKYTIIIIIAIISISFINNDSPLKLSLDYIAKLSGNEETETIELNKYITNAKINYLDGSNVEIMKEETIDGVYSPLLFTNIDFNISIKELYNKGKWNGNINYHLPDELLIYEKSTDTNIYDSIGNKIGQYEIDNNDITLKFYEDKVSKSSLLIGKIGLCVKIDFSNVRYSKNVGIEFNDNILFNVYFEKNVNLNMSNNIIGSPVFNKEKSEIKSSYKVDIVTTSGTKDKVKVSDILTPNDNIISSKYENMKILKYTELGESDSIDITNEIDISNWPNEIVLPLMEPGTKYSITYDLIDEVNSKLNVILDRENKVNITTINSDYTSYNNNSVAKYSLEYIGKDYTDINVIKSIGDYYIGEDGYIYYPFTIKIETTYGTESITLNDTLTNINLKNNIILIKINNISKNGTPYTCNSCLNFETGEITDYTKSIITGTLPKLNANENYVIEYEIGIQDLGSDFSLNNNIRVIEDEKESTDYKAVKYTHTLDDLPTFGEVEANSEMYCPIEVYEDFKTIYYNENFSFNENHKDLSNYQLLFNLDLDYMESYSESASIYLYDEVGKYLTNFYLDDNIIKFEKNDSTTINIIGIDEYEDKYVITTVPNNVKLIFYYNYEEPIYAFEKNTLEHDYSIELIYNEETVGKFDRHIEKTYKTCGPESDNVSLVVDAYIDCGSSYEEGYYDEIGTYIYGTASYNQQHLDLTGARINLDLLGDRMDYTLSAYDETKNKWVTIGYDYYYSFKYYDGNNIKVNGVIIPKDSELRLYFNSYAGGGYPIYFETSASIEYSDEEYNDYAKYMYDFSYVEESDLPNCEMYGPEDPEWYEREFYVSAENEINEEEQCVDETSSMRGNAIFEYTISDIYVEPEFAKIEFDIEDGIEIENMYITDSNGEWQSINPNIIDFNEHLTVYVGSSYDSWYDDYDYIALPQEDSEDYINFEINEYIGFKIKLDYKVTADYAKDHDNVSISSYYGSEWQDDRELMATDDVFFEIESCNDLDISSTISSYSLGNCVSSSTFTDDLVYRTLNINNSSITIDGKNRNLNNVKIETQTNIKEYNSKTRSYDIYTPISLENITYNIKIYEYNGNSKTLKHEFAIDENTFKNLEFVNSGSDIYIKGYSDKTFKNDSYITINLTGQMLIPTTSSTTYKYIVIESNVYRDNQLIKNHQLLNRYTSISNCNITPTASKKNNGVVEESDKKIVKWEATIKNSFGRIGYIEDTLNYVYNYNNLSNEYIVNLDINQLKNLELINNNNSTKLSLGTDYTISDIKACSTLKTDSCNTYNTIDEVPNNYYIIYFKINLNEDLKKVTEFKLLYTSNLYDSSLDFNRKYSISNKVLALTTYSNKTNYSTSSVTYQRKDTGVSMKKSIIKDDASLVNNDYVFYDKDNNYIYYEIEVNKNGQLYQNGNIVIEDTLPEGTTLVTDKWEEHGGVSCQSTSFCNNGILLYRGKELGSQILYTSSSSSSYFTPTYDESTRKLSIAIKQNLYQATSYSYPLFIYYKVKVNDDLDDDKEYINKSIIKYGDKIDTSNEVTTKLLTKKINKSYSLYNSYNKELSYNVIVNKKGKDLVEGDTLQIEDTLNYEEYSELINGISLKDVKVYEYNDETNTKEENTIDNYTYTFENNKLSMEIPDNIPLYIEYSYIIDYVRSDLPETYNLNNEVVITNAINEYNIDNVTSNIKHNYTYVIANPNSLNIKIENVDKNNNNIKLNNTTYILEEYKDGAWINIGEYNTDTNGQINLSDDKNTLYINTLYRLSESTPTDGYEPNNGYTYIYVNNDSFAKGEIPEGMLLKEEITEIEDGKIMIYSIPINNINEDTNEQLDNSVENPFTIDNVIITISILIISLTITLFILRKKQTY